MLFSRFIFVSTALFAGSAAAFSVQPSTSVPKTALYASSSDNEGVIERRQVLASLAATAAASLGASSAFAFNTPDVSAGGDNAANTLKDNAREIEKNVFDRPNMDPGQSMNKGFELGKSMSNDIGLGKAADNVKSDVKSVAEGVNPFSGGNNLGVGNAVGGAADKVKSDVQTAANNLNPFSGGNNVGLGNPVGGAAGKVKSDVQTAANNINPFSGGNNLGQGKNLGGNSDVTKGDDFSNGVKNALGLSNVSDSSKKDFSKIARGNNPFFGQGMGRGKGSSTETDDYSNGVKNALGLGNK